MERYNEDIAPDKQLDRMSIVASLTILTNRQPGDHALADSTALNPFTQR
ncbi:MAG: hypothetical protein LZF86_10157 [Nitrospira sp.]|nr:MAG: hypothetical protein LZF86_10157 [Nitrospira sp.]